jgi:hypothetical protein
MLRPPQIVRLSLLSLVLWAIATAYIRLWPAAFTDPAMGAMGFVTTFPMAWLSVWLVRKAGGLDMPHLLAGVSLVGAIALMIDGTALRFFPHVYGDSDTVLRLGAAWLLWGYGVSLGIALLWLWQSGMTQRA